MYRDAVSPEITAQGVVEIVGPDLERSLAFYEALGFQLERKTGPFAVISGYGIRLFLAEDPSAPTTERWTNVRIMVDDVDTVWNRVIQLGMTPGNNIGDRFYGLRDFVITDPSGFELRFAQAV